MQVIAQRHATLTRRAALKTVALSGLAGLTATTLPAWSQAPTAESKASDMQDVWRALSRIGYGPTPFLITAIAYAQGPRAWAQSQIDAAHVASQLAPSMATDLVDFNAALPTLFEGVRKEREARQQRKENAADATDPQKLARLDPTSPQDPLHFSRKLMQQAGAWRLLAASQPELENPLLARMTEFWFNHLNVYAGKGAVRPFVGHYWVNVARKHALGRYEDLLLASARHPAMLAYLDQAQSVAEGSRGAQGRMRGLNENYARELMELHTLGASGGYTQTDVRELARVLTGWTIGPQEDSGFRFAARLHDADRKVVLGERFPRHQGAAGEQEGIDAIRMLARHPSTAQRISLRLAQYFISDNPPPAVVARLRNTFLSTQGDTRALLRVLLESPEFWAPDQKLFKTPMDYAASALAAVQAVGTPAGENSRRGLLLASGFLAAAGQPLFEWQTPDGYKFDAATWLVPEALTRRADFALALARNTPEPAYLIPFLGSTTRETIAREPASLRAGLMLASPEFMTK